MLSELEKALFSEEASRILLAHASVEPDVANSLVRSGFFAVEKSGLSVLVELLFMNPEPIDLFHNTAHLEQYRRLAQPRGTDVVIVDRFTGAMFRPAQLTPAAAFGAAGDLAADLSYLGLDSVAVGRSRFREFPYFAIRTREELAEACERIARYEKGEQETVLFRGQTKDHLLTREKSVLEFLYGTSSVREPSILSNAFRNRFNYAAAEPYLRLVLRDILFRRTGTKNTRHWAEDRFESVNLLSLGNELSEALIDVMGISQHYGVPTYGTDVTSSWETAFWFATHRYEPKEKLASYLPHRWDGEACFEWPVVYVIKTKVARDLQLLKFPSIRAKAQNAFFLGGSWGVHGNEPANSIICALFLSPAVGVDYHETPEIFPMPSNDPMYRELLEAKRRHACNDVFSTTGLSHVFELQY